MRRLRVAASLVAATPFVALAIVGCGDDDVSTANVDAGPRSDVVVLEAGEFDATEPNLDAGSFLVVDLPDTPCVARADAGKIVFANAPFDPIISLSAFGEKRVVQRASGFLVMDADGSNPTAMIASSRAATALDATTIAAVSNEFEGPLLSLFDANGTPKATKLLAYDSPPYGTTVGAADGEGLMVWGSPYGVFARGIATTAFIGPAFALAGSGAVGGFAASVARKPSGEFATAFSGVVPDEEKRAQMSIVRTTTTGRIATGFHLETSTTPRRVVQLVPRAIGWALLFDYGAVPRAHLALLDAEGRLEGPVYRLAGTSLGYGLASSGGELGVFALHEAPALTDAGAPDAEVDADADASTTTDPSLPRVAFRAFDDKGAALGDWACFGDGVDSRGGTEGAILGEANGYTLAYPKANGDVVVARIDRRGN